MKSLWEAIAARGAITGEFRAREATVALAALEKGSLFPDSLESMRDRSVLLATHEQLATALALVELDGVARRIVLCTPDLTPTQLSAVANVAEAEVLITDAAAPKSVAGVPQVCGVTHIPTPHRLVRRGGTSSEWILLTSGTTGTPKLVLHSFESLAGTLPRTTTSAEPTVWSTFYDIRRYGGLQIYLRAVLAGVPLVLSAAQEPIAEHLARAGAAGVTHISGTPSHWRRALMSGATQRLAPRYVRLSGEVADQPVLDSLRAAFPGAGVAHAFASTEAGVAFDVNDGLAGFPASLLAGTHAGSIDVKVEDGTLRIRSGRNAARYLGAAPPLIGSDGFVDTGDLVERVGDRWYFRGRRGGVINVGGLKVFPEEVEAVLNADPRVRMSRVRARRNPVTGALVVADVVLEQPLPPGDADRASTLKHELLKLCRDALPAHKVPATLQLVDSLPLSAGGKLVRPDA